MPLTSEPACGSDRQYAPSHSPPSIRGSHSWRSSSLPLVATTFAVSVCTLTPTPTLGQAVAISSTTWRYTSYGCPPPPYSSGNGRLSSPDPPSSRYAASGNSLRSSAWRTPRASSLGAISRVSSRTAAATPPSSGSKRSTVVPTRAMMPPCDSLAPTRLRPVTRRSAVWRSGGSGGLAVLAVLGEGVQGDGRGDARVEGLQGRRHRDRDQAGAGLAHQPAQPVSLGADHHDERPGGQVGVGEQLRERQVARGRETDDLAAGVLEGLQGPHQVRHLGDRDPSRSAGRGLPRGRGHPGSSALGDHDAVGAEARRRPHDGAEVARVRHRVERHDQRRLPALGRSVQQVRRPCVLVRRDPGSQSLVHRPVGTPVELAPGHLQERDAVLGGDPERLTHTSVALGALGDVQAAHRYAGPQRLDHRVPPGDPLVVAAGAPFRASGLTLGGRPHLVRLVVGTVRRLGRRTLALQSALDPASGSRGRTLRGLPDGAPALAVARHQGPSPERSANVHVEPSGVSSTAMPAAAIRSRMASARPQSFSARAAARSSSSPATSASTTADSFASSEPPTLSQAGSAGSSPSTPSMASTDVRLPRSAGLAPPASSLLPSVTT